MKGSTVHQTHSQRDLRQKASTWGAGPVLETWSKSLELALALNSLPVLLNQTKQTREEGGNPHFEKSRKHITPNNGMGNMPELEVGKMARNVLVWVSA